MSSNAAADGTPPWDRPRSVTTRFHSALDRAVLRIMKAPRRVPRADEVAVFGDTLRTALEVHRQHGWEESPDRYLQEPPPLERLRSRDVEVQGLALERVSWPSEWEPHPDEPERSRWLRHHANRTAHAWLLRHDDGPRPWVICVHGLGTGFAAADLRAFRVVHLYRGLGLNVALPTLPMHGPRRRGLVNLAGFLTADLIEALYGMAQSVWDVRRLAGWLRREDGTPVAVHGVSLGGYVTGLLAGVEDDLDAVIAGVPFIDFPELVAHHAPDGLREVARDAGVLDGTATAVLGAVSPLNVAPRVPRERRFVYAGIGDDITGIEQARRLWEHWERPEHLWYEGGHLGCVLNASVRDFIDRALVRSGLFGR